MIRPRCIENGIDTVVRAPAYTKSFKPILSKVCENVGLVDISSSKQRNSEKKITEKRAKGPIIPI